MDEYITLKEVKNIISLTKREWILIKNSDNIRKISYHTLQYKYNRQDIIKYSKNKFQDLKHCKHCCTYDNLMTQTKNGRIYKLSICKQCYSEQLSIGQKKGWTDKERRRKHKITQKKLWENENHRNKVITRSVSVRKQNFIKKYEDRYYNKLQLLNILKIETDTTKEDYLNFKIFNIKCPKCNHFRTVGDAYITKKHLTLTKGVCRDCSGTRGNSKPQEDIFKFLLSIYSDEIIYNGYILKTKQNTTKQIDIYMPKLKIGIEYNGLYFHSTYGKDYQINKLNMSEAQGIRLIQITSYDWFNKQDKIKNLIKNLIGVPQKRIYGRKCIIKEISSEESKMFLNNYHLQNNSFASVRLGLFYDDTLLQVMTFGKSRTNKKYEYELIRLCTRNTFRIIGGANKILKYFEKTYNPKSLISYCDKSYFSGNIYVVLGFKFSHESKPNYIYFKNDLGPILSRYKCQKHKLKKLLPIFNEDLTEEKNMFINKYYKYYDCGNKVFVKDY